MAKRAYTVIAEHFGTDSETVRDHDYQPGRYTKRVYDINDTLWCAGATPAQPTRGGFDKMKWEKVISSYDKKSILWKQIKEE